MRPLPLDLGQPHTTDTGDWPGPERREHSRPDGGTKPVDFGYLDRFTLGNAQLEAEILGLFCVHAPRYLAALRDAATAQAWQAAAHTLKGAASGIGAWRVGRMAEAAERIAFDGHPDKRSFAFDSTSEAIDEAIGYIRTLYPKA
jgi:HPt (histidine-containing phosphotransfer) domain-containing protein